MSGVWGEFRSLIRSSSAASIVCQREKGLLVDTCAAIFDAINRYFFGVIFSPECYRSKVTMTVFRGEFKSGKLF